MRQSFTAAIERNSVFTASFATEPYEAGWATEARWFIRVMDLSGDQAQIVVTPQISPDGLDWCDHEAPPLTLRATGLYSFPLHQFGNWLRLHAELLGDNPSVKVFIYVALKE